MDHEEPIDDARLSRIETHWSLVRQAHAEDQAGDVVDAKQQLLLRYAPPIRRYLGAALQNPEAADEVFQEFAVKFSRGDFRTANPERGQFRQFVKTSLYRLIVDYHRQRAKSPKQAPLEDVDIPIEDDTLAAADEEMLLAWRDELLNAAWEKLEEYSRQKQAAFYLVLRVRVENPQWSSDELAEHISRRLGKNMTAGGVRVVLHRARQRFAESLLDALTESLARSDDTDALEAEVAELRLLDYCREALAARRG